MRSIKTEGESCMLVFELCSTQLCEALDLFEAEDELAEPAPAGVRRPVGVMGDLQGLQSGPRQVRPAISRALRWIRKSSFEWAPRRPAEKTAQA